MHQRCNNSGILFHNCKLRLNKLKVVFNWTLIVLFHVNRHQPCSWSPRSSQTSSSSCLVALGVFQNLHTGCWELLQPPHASFCRLAHPHPSRPGLQQRQKAVGLGWLRADGPGRSAGWDWLPEEGAPLGSAQAWPGLNVCGGCRSGLEVEQRALYPDLCFLLAPSASSEHSGCQSAGRLFHPQKTVRKRKVHQKNWTSDFILYKGLKQRSIHCSKERQL